MEKAYRLKVMQNRADIELVGGPWTKVCESYALPGNVMYAPGEAAQYGEVVKALGQRLADWKERGGFSHKPAVLKDLSGWSLLQNCPNAPAEGLVKVGNGAYSASFVGRAMRELGLIPSSRATSQYAHYKISQAPGFKQQKVLEVFTPTRSTFSETLKERDRWLNILTGALKALRVTIKDTRTSGGYISIRFKIEADSITKLP